MRIQRRGVVLLGTLVVAMACDDPPCTESGIMTLGIPDSRVATVTAIRSEGVCEVYETVESCDAGGCGERSGVPIRLYRVIARSQGDCDVTVEFSDGCPSETLRYEWRDSIENCCTDICFQGGGAHTLGEGCESDGG